MASISAAFGGPLPVEVTFMGTVTSEPREFIGTQTQARHEAFGARTDDGLNVEIVDNVDLAPRVPVVRGDRIGVRGELVADRDGSPIVHWTHHDPAARHPGGWIDLQGRRYA